MVRFQRLILIVILCFTSKTNAVASVLDIDLASLNLVDRTLVHDVDDLCIALGDDACKQLRDSCKESPLPNTCVLRTFYFTMIDVQLCGRESAIRCGQERIEFGKKIEVFVKKYANNPGIGRAALNTCAPFFEVEPDKSKAKLLYIRKKLNEVMSGLGDYTENKGYFECIKGQYLKMAVK